MRAKFKSTINFGIIGLGRFGLALADQLADYNDDILVIDRDETRLKNIQDKVANVYSLQQLDKNSLAETGIQNCETVIVCIGEDMQMSIITTLNVIELGVPRVIARAVSVEHGRVLEKIGAEVIYPERDRALRLAQMLMQSRALECIQLSDEFSISQFDLHRVYEGISIIDADFRNRFGLNIIAISSDGFTTAEIDTAYKFKENDTVVVAGRKESIQLFDEYLRNFG
ncbi:MAG TPA: TrkA family potassium uptake protein [Firmicutes bacterium]|nr:TrkA family potassium uptake protein [Bacillota bacterium]